MHGARLASTAFILVLYAITMIWRNQIIALVVHSKLLQIYETLAYCSNLRDSEKD